MLAQKRLQRATRGFTSRAGPATAALGRLEPNHFLGLNSFVHKVGGLRKHALETHREVYEFMESAC
ncbi:hypothetical protein NUU61_004870 [Penicillium alfredii]|uniref:Uncharacterized protein n=1 Tax=Penicillium alfredii TaxID=1506179 RepID=A0A9W9F8F9_9EURO|nr:uncharacterized protein NUU61_004870 [Penicillium alfredii]KAJ5095514.1 hypothetical protein NUU61_004870 [Penicillium alfredii]